MQLEGFSGWAIVDGSSSWIWLSSATPVWLLCCESERVCLLFWPAGNASTLRGHGHLPGRSETSSLFIHSFIHSTEKSEENMSFVGIHWEWENSRWQVTHPFFAGGTQDQPRRRVWRGYLKLLWVLLHSVIVRELKFDSFFSCSANSFLCAWRSRFEGWWCGVCQASESGWGCREVHRVSSEAGATAGGHGQDVQGPGTMLPLRECDGWKKERKLKRKKVEKVEGKKPPRPTPATQK